jgi:putative transposase
VRRQCELLKLNRSSLYYQPVPVSEAEATLLRLLDEQYLETPFYGSRKMVQSLLEKGYVVNRKRVQRLMQKLGLRAVFPGRDTSKPHPEHRVYPYLLRGLEIAQANHVWCTDITYLPIGRGHYYLVAVMDWYSRKVLSWRISNTLDVHFCVDALEDAIAQHGHPEIFNSDQGSQFTSNAFTERLKAAGIQISMDGRGRCHDNIFIERLWRTVKYELIYLKAFEDGQHLKQEVKVWFRWYNEKRFHQGLGYKTPNHVYDESQRSVNAIDTDQENRS